MKYYRKGRLETAHDQSRNAGLLTVCAWLTFALAIGLIPYAFVMSVATLVFIFTCVVSLYLIGLYAHVHPILKPMEKRKFLHIVWAFALTTLVLNFLGPMLLLAIPSVFNLICVAIFKTLQRT